jgi:nitrate/nitrite transporter NarK
MTVAEKWLTMMLLCLSGSTIYWLPYFSEIYYVPMQDAFGFSNTQLGVLSSTFGITSLIGYFPGGWLADRFSSRKLISVALVITAAGAFVFSTMPPFKICVLLFGLWGIATACVFWSAMIKATRNWGSSAEQGRAFGILEGGRKIVDMASATLLLSIFAFRGGDDAALSEIIQLLAVSTLFLAVLVWTVMKDDNSHDDYLEESPTHTAAGIIEVLKLPIVWMMAIIIMAAYSGLWGAIYFTPYATEVYELGSVLGGAIGVGKLWLAAFVAIAAGFIADKIGTAKAIVGSFVLMTSGFLIFGLVPGGPGLVPLLMINGAVISCAVYGLRGIYFALLEQGGIPVAITGTVTGVVSVIGYTPDIFLPVLGGMILDASPGADGYQNLFLFVAALSFLGLVAAYVTYRKIQVDRATGSF